MRLSLHIVTFFCMIAGVMSCGRPMPTMEEIKEEKIERDREVAPSAFPQEMVGVPDFVNKYCEHLDIDSMEQAGKDGKYCALKSGDACGEAISEGRCVAGLECTARNGSPGVCWAT